MEKSCLRFKSYKAFLSELIEQSGQRGIVTRLAEAAHCQRSYLSQVIHSNAHLTPDQTYAITQYLGFSDPETEYFLLLVDMERAATPGLRNRISDRLEKLKKDHLEVSKRIKPSRKLDFSLQQTYYSSWHFAAIHILVSSPLFQTVDSISKRLSLDKRTVEHALKVLQQAKLVERDGDTWKTSGGDLHLEKGSPLLSFHHGNWRARAVLDSQVSEESLHYTSVFALRREHLDQIREIILKAIQDVRREVEPSPSEDLACFNCDLFWV